MYEHEWALSAPKHKHTFVGHGIGDAILSIDVDAYTIFLGWRKYPQIIQVGTHLLTMSGILMNLLNKLFSAIRRLLKSAPSERRANVMDATEYRILFHSSAFARNNSSNGIDIED